MRDTSSRRIAPILGALGALGPLSIDMYLPAMPQIAANLNVGEGQVQFSLMSFFAGLMIGQLFYGPISDSVGRKPVIYAGLLLFIVGSIGSITAGTAEQLAAWRFIHGLGGSAGMVMGLAIVRDLYTGQTAAKLIAMMMLVLGVAPILAPLLGSAIIAVAPWQALFGALALFGVAGLVLVWIALPETRMEELRAASRPLDAVRNYAHLLASRRFLPYVAVAAFAQAGFFAYLAGSSFVFISLHGLTPAAYSAVFAVNSIGLIAAAQTVPHLMGRFRPQTIVRASVAVYAATAVSLAAVDMAGGASLGMLAASLFVIIAARAIVMPVCSVMALESYGAISGTASALLGALQFGAGTFASFIVGATANGAALPMIAAIAVCGVAACVLAFAAFPKTPSALSQERHRQPASAP
ncbi:multidrug effflux MFS transporter [Methylosinus sp. LW4]|uniref:multidrug effflux MFS transporter n=1 Tax=Methylosinus sp. LW4 TaxID=136993 RepID=UPI0004779786|nr:multidrug effflux MFS transporter [Methylosinus sp. LW4]